MRVSAEGEGARVEVCAGAKEILVNGVPSRGARLRVGDGIVVGDTPLVVAHGTCETPEFQRQTRDFAAQVTAAGKPVELLIGEGYNHFEMLETLANPYGLLGRAMLAQMRLGQGKG